MVKKVYYAHCIALYDTKQEERDVAMLKTLGFEVLNPNMPEHQIGCRKYKDGSKNVMEYFTDLVRTCDVLAFRGLPTLEIPAGVAKEINTAILSEIPVIELPSRTGKRGLSIEDTRAYIREVGKR